MKTLLTLLLFSAVATAQPLVPTVAASFGFAEFIPTVQMDLGLDYSPDWSTGHFVAMAEYRHFFGGTGHKESPGIKAGYRVDFGRDRLYSNDNSVAFLGVLSKNFYKDLKTGKAATSVTPGAALRFVFNSYCIVDAQYSSRLFQVTVGVQVGRVR